MPMKSAAAGQTGGRGSGQCEQHQLSRKEPGFAPIVAPPLPISATKDQQLDALLTQIQGQPDFAGRLSQAARSNPGRAVK